MKKLLCILFVILGVAFNVHSQTISGVSGTITDGSTITISGSGFGTKSTVMPCISSYDHSTSAWNWNTTGTISGEWATNGPVTISSSSPRTSTAPYKAVCATGGGYPTVRWNGTSGEGNFFYASFWYYITEEDVCVSTGSANYKAWRWYTSTSALRSIVGSYYNGGSCTSCEGYLCGKLFRFAIDNGYGDIADWTNGYSYAPAGQWNHKEFILYHGSGSTATNGYIVSVLNGHHHVTWTGFGLGTPANNLFMVGIASGDNYAGGTIQVSEIYIDNTEAHVFIANSASITDWKGYSGSYHSEVQVPTSWADGSIAVTVNRGSFGAADTAYLYVVDSAGDTSNAYPITFGDSASDTTAPTILTKTINSAGNTLTIVYDENVRQGGAYSDSHLNLDGSIGGNDIALTYVSGNTTSTHIYSIGTTIKAGETVNLDITGASDRIEDLSDNYLATVTDGAVTNNSTVDGTAPTLTGVVIIDATHTQFTFSETVTESGSAANWAFTLSGGAVVLSNAVVVGSVITYENHRSVAGGETLSDLDYPALVNGIEDAAGNDFAERLNYDGDFTNSVAGTDVTDPVITITTPGTNPYTSESQFYNVEGTASDNVAVTSVVLTCPTCQEVGANTGSLTAWSFPVTLSQGALGSDILNGMGDFAYPYEWYYAAAWSIAGGVITNTGASVSALAVEIGNLEDNSTYLITYTVGGTPSGDLWLSQYGFGGVSTLLVSTVGEHEIEVVCTEPLYPLRFVANPWAGTLDNITVQKKGYNEITVTAHDAAANTGSDTVSVAFVAPDVVTPRRVMGLSATVKIDLGGGVQLEF